MHKFTCYLAAVAALTLSMTGIASADEHHDWHRHGQTGYDHRHDNQGRRMGHDASARGDAGHDQGHFMASQNGGHPAQDDAYTSYPQDGGANGMHRP